METAAKKWGRGGGVSARRARCPPGRRAFRIAAFARVAVSCLLVPARQLGAVPGTERAFGKHSLGMWWVTAPSRETLCRSRGQDELGGGVGYTRRPECCDALKEKGGASSLPLHWPVPRQRAFQAPAPRGAWPCGTGSIIPAS